MEGPNGSHRRTSGDDKYVCTIDIPKEYIVYACVSGLWVSAFKLQRREPEKFFHFLPQLKVVWFMSTAYVSKADSVYSVIKCLNVL